MAESDIISPRLLDWICRGYLAGHGGANNTLVINGVDIRTEYLAQVWNNGGLAGFDFFARKNGSTKPSLHVNKKPTTRAQIRAMNWAYEIGLIDYLADNPDFLADVESHIKSAQAANPRRKTAQVSK